MQCVVRRPDDPAAEGAPASQQCCTASCVPSARTAIDVEQRRAQAGEVRAEAAAHGLHGVGHAVAEIVRGQADEQVHLPDADDLPEQVVRNQTVVGHTHHSLHAAGCEIAGSKHGAA